MVRVELGCSNPALPRFPGTWDKKSDSTEQFSLTRAGFDVLSATYERGEDLYGASKLELEQSLIALAGIMLEESKEVADFAKNCE